MAEGAVLSSCHDEPWGGLKSQEVSEACFGIRKPSWGGGRELSLAALTQG